MPKLADNHPDKWNYDFHTQVKQPHARRTVTFDHILGETIDETGTCRECDYRACLKSLERDGRVTIRRITSKARGLSGLDQVSFPARP